MNFNFDMTRWQVAIGGAYIAANTAWNTLSSSPWSLGITSLFGTGTLVHHVSPYMPEIVANTTAKAFDVGVRTFVDTTASGGTWLVDRVGLPLLGKTTEVFLESTLKATGKIAVGALNTAYKTAGEIGKNPETFTQPVFGDTAPAGTMGLPAYLTEKLKDIALDDLDTVIAVTATISVILAGGLLAYVYYVKEPSEHVKKTAEAVHQTTKNKLPSIVIENHIG